MMMRQRLLLACVLGMVSSAPAAAQPAPVVSVPFGGTEAFGHILHSFDLEPVAPVKGAARLAPEKTLVIIFGDLANAMDPVAKDWGDLETFRERGGAVLLATDYPDRSRLPARLSSRGHRVSAMGA